MLYNLQYDYIQENKKYLIFFRDSGLIEKELEEIEIKMIESNKIPRFLPLTIEEINLNIKLKYDITAKRSLNYYLVSHKLNLNQYFSLLTNVITVLEDSKIYMLNEQNYLLNADFIFIGQDVNDIYLTYLPIKLLPGKVGIIDEFINLAEQLIKSVNEEEKSKFQDLIEEMKRDSDSIVNLKQRVITLMKRNMHGPPKEQVNKPKSIQVNEFVIEEKNGDVIEKTNTELQPLTERGRIFLLLSIILSIAVIWKIYLIYPLEAILYISSGLTILVLDIGLIIAKLWRPSKMKNKKVKSTTPKQSKSKRLVQGLQKERDYYHHLGNETTLLKKDDTMLLHEVIEGKAFLEKGEGNEKEVIEINSNNFIVGRIYSSVNYVEKSKGVSRLHFEIVKNNFKYEIKDLFSKNGTYLNNQKLIPNKIYPLKNGDVIRLNKIEFVFKVEVKMVLEQGGLA